MQVRIEREAIIYRLGRLGRQRKIWEVLQWSELLKTESPPRTYRWQAEMKLIRNTLGPGCDRFVGGEVVPCMPTVFVK